MSRKQRRDKARDLAAEFNVPFPYALMAVEAGAAPRVEALARGKVDPAKAFIAAVNALVKENA